MASRSFFGTVSAGLMVLALAACGSTPDKANWLVTFAGGAAPADTVVVHAEIRSGGCDGPVVYSDDVRSGEGVGMSPQALPEGTYGFRAEARDGTCNVLARGCTQVDVPVSGAITVNVVAVSATPACPLAMCSSGVCATPPPMDLGVDLGVDAGPPDLGPPPDFGIMPCSPEGSACGSGSTAGTCRDGNCCPGCWDSTASSCRAGSSNLECGGSGEACVMCTSGQMCTAGRCEAVVSSVEPQPLALAVLNSFVLLSDGRFASAGDDASKQRGTPRTTSSTGWSYETYTGAIRFVALAATQFSAYGITADGQLYAWGTNVSGLLGNGSGVPSLQQPMPTRVGTDLWRTVDGGAQHVCGIRQDRRLLCWGDRTDGRVGEGAATGPAPTPLLVGTSTWTAISAGERHTCGVQADGSLWCWGYNSTGVGGTGLTSGQLGSGDTLDRAAPNRVGTDNDWRSVSAGVAHTCAIKSTNALYCWGEGGFWGRLGIGVTNPLGMDEDILTPMQVADPPLAWSAVAAGNFHTCGIAGGEVYCWGLGVRGATGTGVTTADPIPAHATTSGSYSDVGAGATHSCARSTTGSFSCWGEVAGGRTGADDPAGMNLLVPTPISL